MKICMRTTCIQEHVNAAFQVILVTEEFNSSSVSKAIDEFLHLIIGSYLITEPVVQLPRPHIYDSDVGLLQFKCYFCCRVAL